MNKFLLTSFAATGILLAQRPGGGGNGTTPLASLKTASVPSPSGLDLYVKDETALVALGKALFWDMQAGSDGRTACASCHFHAGADHRAQNQLAGNAVAPNALLTSSDFPFHQLSNVNDNRSAVVRDARQMAGSAGVVSRTFLSLIPGLSMEDFTAAVSNTTLAGVQTRRVTARNSPSVINSVFYVRNFWDGRASNLFTGATPFGDSDTSPNAWVYEDGSLQARAVKMQNSSLASQAVGPALNEVEMSYAGRTWPDLGRKLMGLPPLGQQKVAADDSVLGAMANANGNGLLPAVSYQSLIQAAFVPKYWNSPAADKNQMELNFALFWGLAIQAYEATLISNDSRFDQFMEGNRTALTALEQQGMRAFQDGNSQCTQCHNGPELSAAAFTNVLRRGLTSTDPDNAGFFRIGSSPIDEDAGLGGKDGFGVQLFLPNRTGAANGTFKVPGLRNVELTGPYFHNGSQATLEQVVDFYGRNGDFPTGGNLGPGIGRIRLSAQDKTSIVAFLKSLTDERVRYQSAPFDHPSLCVSVGHSELSPGVLQTDADQPGLVALDKWSLIPAIGKLGSATPLTTFEELLKAGGTSAQSCPAAQ